MLESGAKRIKPMTAGKNWQERMGYRLRQGVLWCRVPAGVLALAGLVLALGVHAASIRGIDTETAWQEAWFLHGALFPLVLLAVLIARVVAAQKALSLREFLALVPVSARWLMGLVFVYVLANVFLFVPLSGAGVPVIKDGRFFFIDHGVVREVTEAEYHFKRSVSLRLYSSVWVYLYLFATACLSP